VYEPGFSLGGPIKRDKVLLLHFHGVRAGRVRMFLTGLVNGAETGTIRPRSGLSLAVSARFHSSPASRLRGHLSWLWTPTTSKGTLPAYNGACSQLPEQAPLRQKRREFLAGLVQPQTSYGGSLEFCTHPLGSLSATRINYFWDNYKDTGVPVPPASNIKHLHKAPLVPPELQGSVGFRTRLEYSSLTTTGSHERRHISILSSGVPFWCARPEGRLRH
jgi:hypothetical protein